MNGEIGDCTGPMMGMMLGGGLAFLLLIAVLILAAAALTKYLRKPA